MLLGMPHGLWGRIASCAPVFNRCWSGCLQAIRAGYKAAGPRGYPCKPAPQFLPDSRSWEKYAALCFSLHWFSRPETTFSLALAAPTVREYRQCIQLQEDDSWKEAPWAWLPPAVASSPSMPRIGLARRWTARPGATSGCRSNTAPEASNRSSRTHNRRISRPPSYSSMT